MTYPPSYYTDPCECGANLYVGHTQQCADKSKLVAETVTTPELRVGDLITVHGTGFRPGRPAEIVWISEVMPTGGRNDQSIAVMGYADGVKKVHLGGNKKTEWERWVPGEEA